MKHQDDVFFAMEGSMYKSFYLLFFLSVLVSCDKKDKEKILDELSLSDNSSTKTISQEPSIPVDLSLDDITNTALPNEAYTFDSNLIFIDTTSSQQGKFDSAVELIKKVVGTEEFRSAVLNHSYNGVKTFVDNGGLSNAQIYERILEAAERLFPLKNNAMDMEVQLYTNLSTNVVGYTNTGTKRIYVNTKYFNVYAANSVAANLFHEWLHKVGFGHAYTYSPSRDYSVPYAIGRMIGKMGLKYL
jgi:hypothetical protein